MSSSSLPKCREREIVLCDQDFKNGVGCENFKTFLFCIARNSRKTAIEKLDSKVFARIGSICSRLFFPADYHNNIKSNILVWIYHTPPPPRLAVGRYRSIQVVSPLVISPRNRSIGFYWLIFPYRCLGLYGLQTEASPPRLAVGRYRSIHAIDPLVVISLRHRLIGFYWLIFPYRCIGRYGSIDLRRLPCGSRWPLYVL